MAKEIPVPEPTRLLKTVLRPIFPSSKELHWSDEQNSESMERAEVRVQVDPAQFLPLGLFVVSYGTNEIELEELGLTEKPKRQSGFLRHQKGNGTGCNKTGMIGSGTGFAPEDVVGTRLPPKKICVPNKRGNKLMRSILWRDAYPAIWKWKPEGTEEDYPEVLEELSSEPVKWVRMPIGLWPSVLVSPNIPR